ncbi:spermatogenesis associated 6-like protein [Echeneis naucrates]|uniref:spermatogenesis associated 6-like protein n=1 Tax=Echeneis naucrates TaxID=173247 RepID=UPI0011135114|nr:spermatogenesis-associated protein 6-like [Echeneis naucrates]
MARKALKVVAEIKLRAVSCPGVHLSAKDDIYLSIYFMDQYCQSQCLSAVFPLLFHEKMTFEKIFRDAVDPGDIAVMLEHEMVKVELVQLGPPREETLACFEEDARQFLFPEPKLVPSFSGVDQEILMTRAPHFPGIAPRLEFSTKTTIIECSPDAEINIYPNKPLRAVMRRKTKCSSKPRISSPQRNQPQTLLRRQGGRMDRERCSNARSQSLSPLRAGNTQHLARLSLDSAHTHLALIDTASSSQPQFLVLGAVPLIGLVNGFFHIATEPTNAVRRDCDISTGFSALHFLPVLTAMPAADTLASLESLSHREWEEVNERVRGLLTTPKAIHRLVCEATVSEVDRVLARRSFSTGPP